MKLKYKIGLGIIILLIVLPLFYLAYDRSLMPPKPTWTSPPYTPGETWQQYATRFLESSKKPNALEHYLKAHNLFSTKKYAQSEGIYDIQTIINFGWTKPYPQAENLLHQNHQAIHEIILGAQMKQCVLPPELLGENAPKVMDYLANQQLIKLIVASGKRLEYQKQYRKALHYYLNGIQFSKDMGQKDQDDIVLVLSATMMNYNLRSILQLISQDKLAVDDYQTIISELNRINQEQATLGEVHQISFQQIYKLLYEHSKHPIELAKSLRYPPVKMAIYIFFNRGRILHNYYTFNAELITALTTKSYQEFINIDWNKIWPKELVSHRICHFHFSSYNRTIYRTATLRLTQIQAAIQLYHLENKQWPKGLDDLKPYLTEIPVDPFTDKPFLWAQDSSGKPSFAKASKGEPFAYSVGPDFKDNSAQFVYDPTNGTTSVGDIYP